MWRCCDQAFCLRCCVMSINWTNVQKTMFVHTSAILGCFLYLLFGCFLASVLVWGCCWFSCMLGQLILPLINTLLTPWSSSRKGSAGIFYLLLLFISRVQPAVGTKWRAAHLNVIRRADRGPPLMRLHLCQEHAGYVLSSSLSGIAPSASN